MGEHEGRLAIHDREIAAMKIVLFTPALRTSAIGRMAALVAKAWLQQGHQLTVVRTEAISLHGLATHDYGAAVIPWSSSFAVKSALQAADVVIHQIGNSFDFHEGNLEWLDAAESIVCLHDFYLAHLFYGWASTRYEAACSELTRWYGADAPALFYEYASKSEFIEFTSANMPMTEWIASRAAMVIAHSSWGMNRVLSACAGPVYTLPLAYDVVEADTSRVTSSSGSRPIMLLTVGHVNPNKRIESVIRAIAGSEVLRERVVYHIVGRAEASTILKLSDMAKSLDVRFVMTGEVDDMALSRAFASAYAICCLRWPSLESASASAIEAMLHGKAIMVTDAAFYSELPDDCVVKIPPGAGEVLAIRLALESMISDPSGVDEMGENARAWAIEMFSAERYARRLIEFALPLERSVVLRKTGEYFFRLLKNWGGDASAMASPGISDPLKILSADDEAHRFSLDG